MASFLIHTPPPLNLKQRLHFNSILKLLSTVNEQINLFILHYDQPAVIEFSSNSTISNLCNGIKNFELAIDSQNSKEETIAFLTNSEKMLQIPAMIEEDGSTMGVPNRYIICCTYFYLSLVGKVKGDEWQMTVHFLQSILASPEAVKSKFAPELWRRLFKVGTSDQVARQKARRYKDWLMYYQVISYGEATAPWKEKLNNFGNMQRNRCSGTSDRVSRELKWTMLDEQFEMVNSHDHQDVEKRQKVNFNGTETRDGKALLNYLNEGFDAESESFDTRRLQDLLDESQSDSNTDTEETSGSEAKVHNIDDEPLKNEVILASTVYKREYQSARSHPTQVEVSKTNISHILSSKSLSTISNINFSILGLGEEDSKSFSRCYVEEETQQGRNSTHGIKCFRSFSPKFLQKHSLNEMVSRGSSARNRINVSNSEKDWSDESSDCEKEECLGNFDRAVASLCITKDADSEVTNLWESLNHKTKAKCSSVKKEILDQIMNIIRTSEKEKVVKASLYILSVLISEDTAVIAGIKKTNLYMYYLASALKRKIHEAAVIIYMISPSPHELKNMEILPALVEVACSSGNHNEGGMSLPVTPTVASISMIEILVTAFDYVTNNIHLAMISCPQVLSKFVDVAMNKNIEESVALTGLFVRCMTLNGNCKKFLSQITPVAPFLYLLKSREIQAKSAALEYFYELLRIPRSSAINILHQIKQQGGIDIMHILLNQVQQAELEHRLLAANLLLHLDMLIGSNTKKMFREEAIQILLQTVASEMNPNAQLLSAAILSNIGGTYSWEGESCTAAWLAKKTGLTSVYHKNMFRNIDWLDPCLQDSEIYAWSTKVARGIIKFGARVFNSLGQGIKSKIKNVRHECLVTIAWLGSEMPIIDRSELRFTACEILLNDVTAFLHPGSDLEERVLACFSVYNYTLGKGKQKLLNFSEGSRDSLRRLSGVTWMAEELLKVTEYFLTTQQRMSCVHTQILEIGQTGDGAVTALIFYKGRLSAGYSDGSIKVWDKKGQRSILVQGVKEHKKSVTCFALSEQGDSLLSGSIDKTVRVWKMIDKKLECVEVIQMKEPVHKIDSYADKIFAVTQSKGLKVCDDSRCILTICSNKYVKSIYVCHGKIYIGCKDSSIQEVDIIEDNKIEIKAPEKSWRRRKKPINVISLYKGWVYSAGSAVEGSSAKDWRRHKKPQYSLKKSKVSKVQTMEVVEDFIYLNSSSSPTIIQIWMRGKQQKIGRLSAGGKITSLLSSNDVILTGNEHGLIKGWIPL